MTLFAVTLGEMNFFQQVWWLFIHYYPWLFKGAGLTLLIAITGTVAGWFLGLLIGVVRTISRSPQDSALKRSLLQTVNAILAVYIEVFRGTPMIVQAMVIYYGAAYMGIHMDLIFAGFFIVSINTGAYMAEIVRGGIISIDTGQFEAAHSIGMTHWQTMLHIVLPQVLRNILPATGNEFVINIKDTAVLSVIAIPELFYQTKTVASNYFTYFPAFFIACIYYLVMTFTVTRLLRLLERKLEGPGTYTIHGSHTLLETEIKIGEQDHGRR